jgi:hypothetical protein
MTRLAWRDGVQADEWKCAQAMIKLYFIGPAGFLVAPGTIRTQAGLVYIIKLVATATSHFKCFAT